MMCEDFTPSPGTKSTVAFASSRSGGVPTSPSSCASAMQYQDAWAAASSSSGLVFPAPRVVRDAQLTSAEGNAPLCGVVMLIERVGTRTLHHDDVSAVPLERAEPSAAD